MSVPVGEPVPVTPDLLRSMPLPRHQEGQDKDERGRVLVVAGSVEVPCKPWPARADGLAWKVFVSRHSAPAAAYAVWTARTWSGWVRFHSSPHAPSGATPCCSGPA